MARKPVTNVEGLERTLRALKPRLERKDAALVALARTLAQAVDADPCTDCGTGQNAALWKEYRAAVTALLAVGADPGDEEVDLAAVLTPLRTTGETAS